MTIIAEITVINIPLDCRMVGIHIGLIVRMADSTIKRVEVGWDSVAFDTLSPASLMGTRVDREIQGVMVPGRR